MSGEMRIGRIVRPHFFGIVDVSLKWEGQKMKDICGLCREITNRRSLGCTQRQGSIALGNRTSELYRECKPPTVCHP
jgi:hypothetical protein